MSQKRAAGSLHLHDALDDASGTRGDGTRKRARARPNTARTQPEHSLDTARARRRERKPTVQFRDVSGLPVLEREQHW
eukprot:2559566-Lingulodinium_polyedra.AAC.1